MLIPTRKPVRRPNPPEDRWLPLLLLLLTGLASRAGVPRSRWLPLLLMLLGWGLLVLVVLSLLVALWEEV